MKIYHISILLVIFAGCSFSDGYYTGQTSDPFYAPPSFLNLNDDYGYRPPMSFYYPPVVEPLPPSEFRFDYGGRSVNEQEYEQIRERERMQARIDEMERRNRGLRSRWPYQRYDPLDDLAGRRSSGYRRYNPLDDL